MPIPENPPAGYQTLTPEAIVDNPDAVIEFVVDVLGGTVKERIEHNGRVMHVELMIGDSMLMLGGATAEYPSFPLMAHVYVDDVDVIFAAAIGQGCVSTQEPIDQFYGDRTAGVVDSQGNVWYIATHIEDVSSEEIERRVASL
jgi:uncharacterized glyoxalase superfamily protein PhnB